MVPFLWMWPGIMPTLHSPGVITPGQLAPTMRVLQPFSMALTGTMSRTGMPSVMQTDSSMPASAASRMASAAQGGGTKIIETLAWVYVTASATVLKTGIPSMWMPPLPGVTPATMLAPYSRHCWVWNSPLRPVMPWTRIREFLLSSMDMSLSVSCLKGLSQHFYNSRCRITQVVSDLDIQPRFLEEQFTVLDLAAVHADDDRQGAVDLAGRLNDAVGNHVAAHDAAEDVDKDPFDILILEDDPEGLGHLFAGRPAADVQEVGRLAAALLEHIQGSHGQSGAVDQAADRAGQLDVGQVVFSGGDLQRIELGIVHHVRVLAMTVDGIVVEGDFGVHGHQPAGLGDDQRIDLDQGAVLFLAGAVQVHQQLDAVFADGTAQAQFQRNLAGLIGAQAAQRVDQQGMDLLRRFPGHFLDIHAPFGRSDQG